MVMDATQPQQPSPQSVGREFVRQYYTLLNKAPNHLHRFYNNNSSFIHGESNLVVGQKNIHNSIQQLNFHDCHAKISQVDAQATLGNGVVVQVTGELSNDGQPMRRFTQTFVLAAQSPKKYYVHNDIFRYQDMYPDEENEGETRSENDEDQEQTASTPGNEIQSLAGGGSVVADQSPQPLPAQVVAAGTGVLAQQPGQGGAPQQQAIYYSMPTAGGRQVQVLAAPQGAGVPLAPQFATGAAAGVAPPPVPAAAVTQINGIVAHEDMLPGMPPTNAIQQTFVPQSGSPIMQAGAAIPVATPVLATQPPATVAAAVPVPNAASIPQNSAGVMPGFPLPAIIQQQPTHLLQPQQQQHQPPMNNAIHQHSFQSQTPPITGGAVDAERTGSPNDGMTTNENGTRTSIAVQSTTTSSTTTTHNNNNNENVATTPPVDDFKTINEQQQQEKYEAAKHQHNEPKTYANLFKSSSSSPSGFVNAAMQQQQQIQQQQQMQQNYHTGSSISSTTFSQSNANTSTYNSRHSDTSLRSDNINAVNQNAPLPQRPSTGRMNKDFDQRRPSNTQFGDNQQLFLGNIPVNASEDDLKALFARFGTVLELRILTKTNNKLQPGMNRNPNNYGFITYDTMESVQNCLANCPLYFPENSPDALKLNVEEKKPRTRVNDMAPRQSMTNNMNAQRSMGGGGGGPASRSLSNSGGGMMRGNNPNNNMQRGTSGGGPRIGGGFNRNENRNGPSNSGGQVRGGGSNNAQSGGGNYGGRR